MTGRRTVVIAGGGTGGHLMPALAVATALQTGHPDWRIVMVGAERGIEAGLLPTRSFPFRLFPFEPIYRRQWWKNFRWPFRVWGLIRAVGRFLHEERPALVLGTGGYASGPAVWLAARRGIATALLEQDAYPGVASRWLAPRVREIYLGVPEAERFLRPGPGATVTVTGSPIAAPTPERRPAAVARFGLDDRTPVVLVLGGSQGAVAINELVGQWLERGGADRLTVLWATGKGSFPRFRRFAAPPAVQVFDFLDPVADGYAVADLVVSRAGMMTIAELSAWGLPSILIPLPSAAADHQTKNAVAMAEAGAAILLPQSGLTPQQLGATIGELVGSPAKRSEMSRRALSRGRPGAVADIVTRLERLIGA